jgi:hypothetical protein
MRACHLLGFGAGIGCHPVFWRAPGTSITSACTEALVPAVVVAAAETEFLQRILRYSNRQRLPVCGEVRSTAGNSASNRQTVSRCSSNLPPIFTPHAFAALMTRVSIP